MRKGVIEISPGRIRALVAEVPGGPGDEPQARPLDREYAVSPLEATPDRLAVLIDEAAGEIRSAGDNDPELVMVGNLRGTRLPSLIGRLARRAGLGPLKIPSRREQVVGAFLAATAHHDRQSESEEAVFVPSDSFLGLAVGRPGVAPDWTASRPVTAQALVRQARFNDPPTSVQLEAATSATLRQVGSLAPPDFGRVILVSELVPSIVSLCGTEVDTESAGRGLDQLVSQAGPKVAPDGSGNRAAGQTLVATLVICRALSIRFGGPLELMVPDPARARALLELSESIGDSRHDA